MKWKLYIQKTDERLVTNGRNTSALWAMLQTTAAPSAKLLWNSSEHFPLWEISLQMILLLSTCFWFLLKERIYLVKPRSQCLLNPYVILSFVGKQTSTVLSVCPCKAGYSVMQRCGSAILCHELPWDLALCDCAISTRTVPTCLGCILNFPTGAAAFHFLRIFSQPHIPAILPLALHAMCSKCHAACCAVPNASCPSPIAKDSFKTRC